MKLKVNTDCAANDPPAKITTRSGHKATQRWLRSGHKETKTWTAVEFSERPERGSKKNPTKRATSLSKEDPKRKPSHPKKDGEEPIESERRQPAADAIAVDPIDNQSKPHNGESVDAIVITDTAVPTDNQSTSQHTKKAVELENLPSIPVSDLSVNVTKRHDTDTEEKKALSTTSSDNTGNESNSLSLRTNPFWQYMEASSKLQRKNIGEKELRVKVVDIIGQSEKASVSHTKEPLVHPKPVSSYTFGGLKRKLKTTNFGALKKPKLGLKSDEKTSGKNTTDISQEKVIEEEASPPEPEKKSEEMSNILKNASLGEPSELSKDVTVSLNTETTDKSSTSLMDTTSCQESIISIEQTEASKDSMESQSNTSIMELSKSSEALLAQCKPCFVRLVNFFPNLIQHSGSVPKLKLKKDTEKNWTCSMKDVLPSSVPKSVDKDESQSSDLCRKTPTKQRKSKKKKKATSSATAVLRKSLNAYDRHYISYVSRHGHKQASPGCTTGSIAASNAPGNTPVNSTSSQVSSTPNSLVYKRPFTGPFRAYYMCKKCPLTVFQKTTMKEHIYLHLNIQPYTCSTCSTKFYNRPALASHYNREHPGMEQQFSFTISVKEEDQYLSVESEKHEERQIEELTTVQRITRNLEVLESHNLDKQSRIGKNVTNDSKSVGVPVPSVEFSMHQSTQRQTSDGGNAPNHNETNDLKQSPQVPVIYSEPFQKHPLPSSTSPIVGRLSPPAKASTWLKQTKDLSHRTRKIPRKGKVRRGKSKKMPSSDGVLEEKTSNTSLSHSTIPVPNSSRGEVANKSPSPSQDATVQISISEIVKRKAATVVKPPESSSIAEMTKSPQGNLPNTNAEEDHPPKTPSPKRVRQVSPDKKMSSSSSAAISTAVNQLRELQSTYAIPQTTVSSAASIDCQPLVLQSSHAKSANTPEFVKSSVSVQSPEPCRQEKKNVVYATIGTQTDNDLIEIDDEEEEEDDVIFIGKEIQPKQTQTSVQHSQVATKTPHQTRSGTQTSLSQMTTGINTTKESQELSSQQVLTIQQSISLQTKQVSRVAPPSDSRRQMLQQSQHTNVASLPMNINLETMQPSGATLSVSHPAITQVLKKGDKVPQQPVLHTSQLISNKSHDTQLQPQSSFVHQSSVGQPVATQQGPVQAVGHHTHQNIRQVMPPHNTNQQAVRQPMQVGVIRQPGVGQLSPLNAAQVQQARLRAPPPAYHAVRLPGQAQQMMQPARAAVPGESVVNRQDAASQRSVRAQAPQIVVASMQQQHGTQQAQPVQNTHMHPQQFPQMMMMPQQMMMMQSMAGSGQGQQMMPLGVMRPQVPFMVPFYPNVQGTEGTQVPAGQAQQKEKTTSPNRAVHHMPGAVQQAAVQRPPFPQTYHHQHYQQQQQQQQQQLQQPQQISSRQQTISQTSVVQGSNPPTHIQTQPAIVSQPLVRHLRPPPPLIHVQKGNHNVTNTATANQQEAYKAAKQSVRKGDLPEDLRIRQREDSGDGSPKVTSTTGDQEVQFLEKRDSNNRADFSVFNIKAPMPLDGDQKSSAPNVQQSPQQHFSPMSVQPGVPAPMWGSGASQYQQCYLAPTKDPSGKPGPPVTLIQCGFCCHWFDSMKTLERHMYQNRNSHKGFSCPLCNHGPVLEMLSIKQHYESCHPNEQVVYCPARPVQVPHTMQNIQA